MNTPLEHIGKLLLFTGLLIAGIGIALMFMGKIRWIGGLPGDIIIKRKNFILYFPLATSILLSIILSLILFLIGKRH